MDICQHVSLYFTRLTCYACRNRHLPQVCAGKKEIYISLFLSFSHFEYFLYIWNLLKYIGTNVSPTKINSERAESPPPLSKGICDFGRIDLSADNGRASSAGWIRTRSKIKSHRDRYERRHLVKSVPRICPCFLTARLSPSLRISRGGVFLVIRFRAKAGLVYRISRLRATLPRCWSRDALCWTLAIKGAFAHTVCRGKVRSTSDVGIYRRFHRGERNVATWQPRPTLRHALGILLVRFTAIVHSISTCDDL